jgi:hypothetical protein
MGNWPRIRMRVLVASVRPGGGGRGGTQLWLTMSHCTKFLPNPSLSEGGALTRLQEMSPDGDWNCAEKGLASEIGAKLIVAAAIAVHIPASIPTLCRLDTLRL